VFEKKLWKLIHLCAEEMIGTDERGIIKPEFGKLSQDFPLVRYQRRKDIIKSRDAVCGNNKELILQVEDIPNLASFINRKSRKGDAGNGFFHGR